MLKQISNELGERIKALRIESGLSQAQVAEYLNVDQSLISKLEKGERNISTTVLEKLANLFCCPISSLIYDDAPAPKLGIAYRSKQIEAEDLQAISMFNRIVLNQMQIDQLMKRVEQDD